MKRDPTYEGEWTEVYGRVWREELERGNTIKSNLQTNRKESREADAQCENV